MILFAIFSLAYLLILLSIKPEPLSLRDGVPSFAQNAMGIRVSILLGVTLLISFLLTSNFRFIDANPDVIERYAMQGGLAMQTNSPLRLLAHWLLHINLVHLIANVGALGLLSVYERRVGAKRFTAVLLAGCVASAFSAFFYSDSTRLCGISGGLFALAAAYFVDNKGMPTKDWLKAILFFVFIVGLLMIDSELRTSGKYQDGFQIDHLGHALGAIGGIIYCRLRPLRS